VSSTTGEATATRADAGGEGLDRLCVDTIRVLSMDAVQRAGSGHPGLPMAMAPLAYLLYARFLRHDPGEPDWPDRDRFVLSAGHGSMLLYSALHLAGYDLPLAELARFRQWGSLTPGHPERIFGERATPGVETTTGPLGQGFANGVGMALAERFLRRRFGSEVCDHRIYALCSDGDLMEGVACEAASLAGHLGLGRLIYIYDDNRITIDGPTSLSFDGEDVRARFRAYGWHTVRVADVNDLAALQAALDEATSEESRPSLILARSVIGYPAPTKQGTPKAHGSPLGEEEVRATKRLLGFDPDQSFVVPEAVREVFAAARRRGELARRCWLQRFRCWSDSHPELAAQWQRAFAGDPEPGVGEAIPRFDPRKRGRLATRAAGAEVMAAIAAHLPTMIGGAADLVESTRTQLPDGGVFSRCSSGANVHWGVREHAMGAAVNGLALHGGIVKPYGSTFLVFSDYMRPAIRLSALMRLPVIWVFSHDSIALGEDGPTHQPVEHYAALRAIPGLIVIRPADANETAGAWRVAIEHRGGPVALALTRQAVDVLDPEPALAGVARGAYVLAEADGGEPELTLVGTGSEVGLALAARELLGLEGIAARVVSMPSWELFACQDDAYRAAVIPPALPSVSVEAGIAQGWSSWVSASLSLERFGASAPGPEVLSRLGFTAERLAELARQALRGKARKDGGPVAR
jgi:transketolase